MAALDDINRKLNAEEQQDLMHQRMKEVLEPSPEQKTENDKPVTTYSEIYEKLNPRPSEAELEAERKRQRRNAVIAAIGDGISALANLHYTGKGAPSSFDPKQGLSAKLQERYDKLNAERRAHDKEWRAGYARAQALDQQATAAKKREEGLLARLRQQRELADETRKLKERAQEHREDNDRIRQQQKDQEIAIKKKIADDKAAGRGGYARGSGRGKPQYDNTTKTTKYVDENGRPVTVKDTQYRPSGSGGSSSNNTPPGRRNRNTSNNTPPSRRKNR